MSFDSTFTLVLNLVMLGVFVWIGARCGTILMGFTYLTVINVWMRGLSSYVWSALFGIPTDWVTPAHRVVYTYMSLGGLGFAIGVALAWVPLRRGMAFNHFTSSQRLVQVFMAVGLIGMVGGTLVSEIPTVSALVGIYGQYWKLALLMATIYALDTRNYKWAICLFLVSVPIAIVKMMTTGFAGLLGAFLLQPLSLVCFHHKPNVAKLAVFIAGFLVFLLFSGVWLQTRYLIREDMLHGDMVERTVSFTTEFVSVLRGEAFTPQVVLRTLRDRMDPSEILAQQVRHQPEVEPYAYGRIFLGSAVSALIPRILWPEKPIRVGGADYINRFAGTTFRSEDVSIDLPFQFELYGNFGFWGVVLGLSIFGFLIAKMELAIFKVGIETWRFLTYNGFLLLLVGGGGRLETTLMVLAVTWLANMLLARFLIAVKFMPAKLV